MQREILRSVISDNTQKREKKKEIKKHPSNKLERTVNIPTYFSSKENRYATVA